MRAFSSLGFVRARDASIFNLVLWPFFFIECSSKSWAQSERGQGKNNICSSWLWTRQFGDWFSLLKPQGNNRKKLGDWSRSVWPQRFCSRFPRPLRERGELRCATGSTPKGLSVQIYARMHGFSKQPLDWQCTNSNESNEQTSMRIEFLAGNKTEKPRFKISHPELHAQTNQNKSKHSRKN